MYSSASNVAQFTPNLVSGSTDFSTSTTPTKVAVEGWLSTGCSLIHTALNGAGYSTPVSVSTAPAVYGQVQNLEMIYGAAMAEMTRLTTRTAANERTRGQVFMKMFTDGLDALVSSDLSSAGLSKSATAPIYIGGVSIDRKETLADDTDRVRPSFQRDLMTWSGTTESSDRLEDDR